MSFATALACAALLAASAFLFVQAGTDETQSARSAGDGAQVAYSVEQDGLRYEFHAVMGTETLWRAGDAAGGRENLVSARPADVERMRRSLLERCGVRDLEALRAPHKLAIENLRKLGYL